MSFNCLPMRLTASLSSACLIHRPNRFVCCLRLTTTPQISSASSNWSPIIVRTVLNHAVSNFWFESSELILYVQVPPLALNESSQAGLTPARNNCKSDPSFNVEGGAKLLNTLQNSLTLPTSTTFLTRSVSHFFSLSLDLGAEYHSAHRYCNVRSSSMSNVSGSAIISSCSVFGGVVVAACSGEEADGEDNMFGLTEVFI
mmetsp:Transcript_70038/g.111397  ORF Transcript_70038/g.111397 Transcript_70038/m.111397 type:complete len:200 (+) Transcript_70038:253-852(+)